MSKRHCNSLFFADDKDIADLLLAAKQKLNKQRLIALARSRGIILSPEDDREAIVRYLSRLPTGWLELTTLLRATESAGRKEPTTYMQIEASASTKELHSAIQAVRDNRISGRDEVYSVAATRVGFISVTVQYTEPDTSKTRLFQRQPREVTISFEKCDSGYKVRHQATGRAAEIVKEITERLEEDTSTKVSRRQIELKGVSDPGLRTNFFLQLMRGLPGFSSPDVTDVKVNRMPKDNVPAFAKMTETQALGEDTDLVDATEGEPSEEQEAEAEAKDAIIGVVKRVVLEGEGVLHSEEYKRLTDAGLFVSHAVWKSLESSSEGRLIEFEAQFGDPNEGTGFSYAVLGAYKRKDDGEHRKARSPVDALEAAEFNAKLEQSAEAALNMTIAASQGKVPSPHESVEPSASAASQGKGATPKQASEPSASAASQGEGAAPNKASEAASN
ncbi:hypothetical protein [Myxococcus sp. Y35]|uniref:hypothetical protein n=1 Tax=Pseudomyxococcus flavus TaxID=3115648 RepID=UPI003CE71D88